MTWHHEGTEGVITSVRQCVLRTRDVEALGDEVTLGWDNKQHSPNMASLLRTAVGFSVVPGVYTLEQAHGGLGSISLPS